jgi:predicted nicotinamide N-methyase
MSTVADGDLVQYHVDNQLIEIEHVAGQSTTGGIVWNAALVLMRWLESKRPSARVIVDLSSGTGFLGIVAAKLGYERVVCTDLIDQMALIGRNVARNKCQDRIECVQFEWGNAQHLDALVAKLGGELKADDVLVIGSDLLFCAIRVDMEQALFDAVLALSGIASRMLFVYQSRIEWKEAPFIDMCRQRLSGVVKLDADKFDASDLAPSDDDDDSDSGTGGGGTASLFFEPIPIQFFIFSNQQR